MSFRSDRSARKVSVSGRPHGPLLVGVVWRSAIKNWYLRFEVNPRKPPTFSTVKSEHLKMEGDPNVPIAEGLCIAQPTRIKVVRSKDPPSTEYSPFRTGPIATLSDL